MEGFVTVDGRTYPARRKAGKHYHVRLTVGKNWRSGKQLQHDYTGSSAEEVQRKVDASRRLSDAQMHLIEADKSLAEVFREYMDYQKLCREGSGSRESQFRTLIQPFFPDRTIRSITSEEVWDWQLWMQEEGRTGLYIKIGFGLLNLVMEFGRKKGYVASNPCRYAERIPIVEPEQSILNREQIGQLLIGGKDLSCAGLYAVGLLLGLRISEARGLSWEQVNWEKGTVCVCQQSSQNGGIIPHTKTRRDRTIKIPRAVMLYLCREWDKQERWARENPAWSNPEGLIFVNKKGNMISRRVVDQQLSLCLKQPPGEKKISFHSLRRTVASLITENVSIHAAQYYLGHAERSTTLSYIYPADEDRQRMVARMGDYFGRLLREAGWVEMEV